MAAGSEEPQAESPRDRSLTDGFVNCQFSVNQAALRSMVQPMVIDMLQECQYEDRFTQLEATLDRVQLSLQQKADAKIVIPAVTSVQELKSMLQSKADQRMVSDLKGALARLEETAAYKADQTSVDQVADELQRVAQIAGTKADLSYVNRTNERVQKLIHVSSQYEKQIAELYAARESLEAFRLPQTLQRTRDMLLKTSNNVKSLQDVVALKADQVAVDELVLGIKDVECSVHWKANQQSIVEFNASIHELKRQLDTKAEKLVVEESKYELVRVEEQLVLKAEQQDTQELDARLLSVERVVGQKADASNLNDARARFLSLEVTVEQKADRQEIGEVTTALSSLREWSTRKVEQLISEFSKRPEAEALVAAETAMQRFRLLSEEKVDADAVSQQFDEVGRKLEDLRSDLARQLERKVEQASFEEAMSRVEAMAPTLGSPSTARSYPASIASVSTTDSSAARRSGSNAKLPGSPRQQGKPPVATMRTKSPGQLSSRGSRPALRGSQQ